METQADALVRQYAQEFITGTRTDVPGPDYGYALLALVEESAGLRATVAAALARQTAAIEELEALCEQQRATIESLVVENDDLRATLYVQDCKAPHAARRCADD
jgi:hypothetical protein